MGRSPQVNVAGEGSNTEMKSLELLPEESALERGVAVATVTFYRGQPPMEYLRDRVTAILLSNSWLAAKFIPGGRIVYPATLETPDVDQYLGVAEADITAAEADYMVLNKLLRPHIVDSSVNLRKKGGAAFRVVVVRVASDSSQFLLVMSLNHQLGDGATFYRLYGMLNPETPVEALEPVRIKGFTETMFAVEEAALYTKTPLLMGMVGSIIKDLCRGKKREVVMCEASQAWIDAQKAAEVAREGSGVAFVSTNDVLTSLAFGGGGFYNAGVGLMEVNLRWRDPATCSATDRHAGNYTCFLPFFRGDCDSPALVRQSLQGTGSGPDQRFRAHSAPLEGARHHAIWHSSLFGHRREGSAMPGPLTFLSSKTRYAAITNWASFYKPAKLPECEQTLHLPAMDMTAPCPFDGSVIWRANEGVLGLLVFSRTHGLLPESHPVFGKSFLNFPVRSRS